MHQVSSSVGYLHRRIARIRPYRWSRRRAHVWHVPAHSRRAGPFSRPSTAASQPEKYAVPHPTRLQPGWRRHPELGVVTLGAENRLSNGCSAIPLPILRCLVNGYHVDRKLVNTVRSSLVQLAEEVARLGLGCEGSRLEPPAWLAIIGVFDQSHDKGRLVANGRSCLAICHGSDYV
jgi:hypothetical protein